MKYIHYKELKTEIYFNEAEFNRSLLLVIDVLSLKSPH